MLFVCADKPGSPRDLKGTTSGEDSVTLSWKPPREDGGSDITDYVVEKREALRMTWQNVGETLDTKFTVPRLVEGVSYVFRVTAKNKVGLGEPTELTRSIAAKSPHSKSQKQDNSHIINVRF